MIHPIKTVSSKETNIIYKKSTEKYQSDLNLALIQIYLALNENAVIIIEKKRKQSANYDCQKFYIDSIISNNSIVYTYSHEYEKEKIEVCLNKFVYKLKYVNGYLCISNYEKDIGKSSFEDFAIQKNYLYDQIVKILREKYGYTDLSFFKKEKQTAKSSENNYKTLNNFRLSNLIYPDGKGGIEVIKTEEFFEKFVPQFRKRLIHSLEVEGISHVILGDNKTSYLMLENNRMFRTNKGKEMIFEIIDRNFILYSLGLHDDKKKEKQQNDSINTLTHYFLIQTNHEYSNCERNLL